MMMRKNQSQLMSTFKIKIAGLIRRAFPPLLSSSGTKFRSLESKKYTSINIDLIATVLLKFPMCSFQCKRFNLQQLNVYNTSHHQPTTCVSANEPRGPACLITNYYIKMASIFHKYLKIDSLKIIELVEIY
jgi:hypothetical protein